MNENMQETNPENSFVMK